MSVTKSNSPRGWTSACAECAQQVGPFPTKALAERVDALHQQQHHTPGGMYYRDNGALCRECGAPLNSDGLCTPQSRRRAQDA